MIALLQRVTEAQVDVAGQAIAKIGQGLLVMVGVQADDDPSTATQFVDRVLHYRVFADDDGKMNRSLIDIHGGLLLVPQFTLAANTRKGRRPSFTSAADPEHGRKLFTRMVDIAKETFAVVESGRFGAEMQVRLVNDGPVTFILD